MKLNLAQLQQITCGAARVCQQDDGFHFYRFTEEQEELYKERDLGLYQKTFTASGIQLRFLTDSETLSLAVFVTPASGRRYFCFDLVINGEKKDTLCNFDPCTLPENYPAFPFPLGRFEKTFSLGTGEKEVQLFFPWSAIAVVEKFALDDNATIVPVKEKKKLLCFGDSITQGYDALSPSNKYTTRLAAFLGAEERNKAIGGETFFPDLAKTKEDFIPDCILVAYGTNDWCFCDRKTVEQTCPLFFENLCNTYPDIPIIALTPIWRKSYQEKSPFGDFFGIQSIIQDATARFPQIRCVTGFDFVPKDETYFGDLVLHPNDRGFAAYYESLVARLKTDFPL